jgi:23S rRNA U2552 (ribose-2'-O)-methylase RlmE/FtsJ
MFCESSGQLLQRLKKIKRTRKYLAEVETLLDELLNHLIIWMVEKIALLPPSTPLVPGQIGVCMTGYLLDVKLTDAAILDCITFTPTDQTNCQICSNSRYSAPDFFKSYSATFNGERQKMSEYWAIGGSSYINAEFLAKTIPVKPNLSSRAVLEKKVLWIGDPSLYENASWAFGDVPVKDPHRCNLSIEERQKRRFGIQRAFSQKTYIVVEHPFQIHHAHVHVFNKTTTIAAHGFTLTARAHSILWDIIRINASMHSCINRNVPYRCKSVCDLSYPCGTIEPGQSYSIDLQVSGLMMALTGFGRPLKKVYDRYKAADFKELLTLIAGWSVTQRGQIFIEAAARGQFLIHKDRYDALVQQDHDMTFPEYVTCPIMPGTEDESILEWALFDCSQLKYYANSDISSVATLNQHSYAPLGVDASLANICFDDPDVIDLLEPQQTHSITFSPRLPVLWEDKLNYFRLTAASPGKYSRAEANIREIETMINDPVSNKASVLLVGSGWGAMARPYVERSAKVILVDKFDTTCKNYPEIPVIQLDWLTIMQNATDYPSLCSKRRKFWRVIIDITNETPISDVDTILSFNAALDYCKKYLAVRGSLIFRVDNFHTIDLSVQITQLAECYEHVRVIRPSCVSPLSGRVYVVGIGKRSKHKSGDIASTITASLKDSQNILALRASQLDDLDLLSSVTNIGGRCKVVHSTQIISALCTSNPGSDMIVACPSTDTLSLLQTFNILRALYSEVKVIKDIRQQIFFTAVDLQMIPFRAFNAGFAHQQFLSLQFDEMYIQRLVSVLPPQDAFSSLSNPNHPIRRSPTHLSHLFSAISGVRMLRDLGYHKAGTVINLTLSQDYYNFRLIARRYRHVVEDADLLNPASDILQLSALATLPTEFEEQLCLIFLPRKSHQTTYRNGVYTLTESINRFLPQHILIDSQFVGYDDETNELLLRSGKDIFPLHPSYVTQEIDFTYKSMFDFHSLWFGGRLALSVNKMPINNVVLLVRN